jgi:hypothetical protein
MLDLNRVRADFAAFLADHSGRRHSLDAALMHVVEQAYQQGLADALVVPVAVSAPISDLDFQVAP